MEIVNLFAFRGKEPEDLQRAIDAIGPKKEYGRCLREQLKDPPAFQELSRELHQTYDNGAQLLGRFIASYRKDPESEETKALQKQIEQAGGTVTPVPGADSQVQMPL
ncbi:hypothetical protein KSF_109120 [Reticulibacter mediterranei]|uniref:Uncharacterized protein n=1 Tax=Reticulibacter mediterranei TaxID=2778369 RepID=A0A8J3IZI7_9CHLR|nr:hypothetical protein KSF_109120 [Reticulibacter mediterranei]